VDQTKSAPPPAGWPCGPGPISAADLLAAYGPEHLADAELLEVLLEEPSLVRAAGLLEACGGLGNLLGMGPADLVSLGLTSAEAARVGVMIEVQRRRTRVHRARVCAPGMAWAYLLPRTAGLTEERFGILCLNARGEVIADRILGMGTPLGLVVTPREVMREALRYGATTVLAWHNHPAGGAEPIREDIIPTKARASSLPWNRGSKSSAASWPPGNSP